MDVRGLFSPDRQSLLSLLTDLSTDDWSRPTTCAGWDVRDVVLHILGGDLGNIATAVARAQPASLQRRAGGCH